MLSRSLKSLISKHVPRFYWETNGQVPCIENSQSTSFSDDKLLSKKIQGHTTQSKFFKPQNPLITSKSSSGYSYPSSEPFKQYFLHWTQHFYFSENDKPNNYENDRLPSTMFFTKVESITKDQPVIIHLIDRICNPRCQANSAIETNPEYISLSQFILEESSIYVGSSRQQSRMAGGKGFVPNKTILFRYYLRFWKHYEEELSIHCYGVKGIGKTWNTLLFRNLLLLDNRYRCLYIHDVNNFINSRDPFQTILAEIFFMFPKNQIIPKDYENDFTIAYDKKKSKKKRTKAIKDIIGRLASEQRVIVIFDQFNAYSAVKEDPNRSLKYKEGNVDDALSLIDSILSIKRVGILLVSSMTDEGVTDRKIKNFEQIIFNRTDDEVTANFLQITFPDLSQEQRDDIKYLTGGLPLEMYNFAKARELNQNFEELKKLFLHNILQSIRKEFANFKQKRDFNKIAESMQQLALYIDKGIMIVPALLD